MSFFAFPNLSVKGEYVVECNGQLFCHLMESDLAVFEVLCKQAGVAIIICPF